MVYSNLPTSLQMTPRVPETDGNILTTLLIGLGRGDDDGVEEENEDKSSKPGDIETAPAATFNIESYRTRASQYFAQPLFLTGSEPTIAKWPKIIQGEEQTRKIVAVALESCRICHVTLPSLVKEGSGHEKARLAVLHENDVKVRAIPCGEKGKIAMFLCFSFTVSNDQFKMRVSSHIMRRRLRCRAVIFDIICPTCREMTRASNKPRE
jgi:hypothetical protein